MADKEIVTSAIRHGIVTIARSQLGAHYLLGAAGATPDQEDGAWYRLDSVKLHPNAATGDRKDRGRQHPIMYAATYKGKRYRVCAGRSSRPEIKAKKKGDPENPMHLRLPQQYKWERPERVIDANDSVFGECCVGKRHFDCIHFVNWVLGHVQKRQYGIKHWIKRTKEVKFADARAGDILTRGVKHIGIAAGSSTVVHASDTDRGVVETKITSGNWTRCGRLKSSYWLRYELSPGTVTFDLDEVQVIEAD